jgi:hypothetical protein
MSNNDPKNFRDHDWDHLPSNAVDLGNDHWYAWVQWAPDRDLNPQHVNIPDEPHAGVSVGHLTSDGKPCQAYASIRTPVTDRVSPDDPKWDLVQEEPLTLSPSLCCRLCGDHGFIKDGRWIRA